MSYRRRLSDQLIEAFQNACDAYNEMLAAVLREAANIGLAGMHRPDFVDRRPNSPAFRRALTHQAEVFHA
ncbi:MAG: hypothetical protein VYB59_14290 [Pseudomonadota bacterium]|nr:hypothetical protein [Pseudomonadota bacterium]